jgi:hypothetical protein
MACFPISTRHIASEKGTLVSFVDEGAEFSRDSKLLQ